MSDLIIFDGQIFQTKAWDRGMGKYSLQLLNSFIKQNPKKTIHLLLNENLPISRQRLETIQDELSGLEIIMRPLPIPDEHFSNEAEYQNELNKLIQMEYGSINPTFVLLSAFMFDYYPRFPENSTKILIFYDLIPMLFWEEMGRFFPSHLYMRRFKLLFEADNICCISETVKNDVTTLFGLPPANVSTIDGGYTSSNQKPVKPTSFSVPKKYILMTSGDLPHKNNEVAVQGFGMAEIDKEIRLIITSQFSEESKVRLSKYSNRIIFSGNVSDAELVWLNKNALVGIFPSKYEGLGIPLLDAVNHGKPIVASNIPVFREMTNDAYYFFEVNDPRTLADAVESAISGRDWARRRAHYEQIRGRYTWAETAAKLTKIFNTTTPKSEQIKPHKNLIIVCSNPATSDNTRALESLDYSLQQRYSVAYYFDARGVDGREQKRPTFLNYTAKTFDIKQFTLTAYASCDNIIYLLDNDDLLKLAGVAAVSLPGKVLFIKGGKLLYSEQAVYRALVETASSLASLDEADARDPSKLVEAIDKLASTVGSSKYESDLRKMIDHKVNKKTYRQIERYIDEQ